MYNDVHNIIYMTRRLSHSFTKKASAALVGIAIGAVALSGCGSDDGQSGGDTATGNQMPTATQTVPTTTAAPGLMSSSFWLNTGDAGRAGTIVTASGQKLDVSVSDGSDKCAANLKCVTVLVRSVDGQQAQRGAVSSIFKEAQSVSRDDIATGLNCQQLDKISWGKTPVLSVDAQTAGGVNAAGFTGSQMAVTIDTSASSSGLAIVFDKDSNQWCGASQSGDTGTYGGILTDQ